MLHHRYSETSSLIPHVFVIEKLRALAREWEDEKNRLMDTSIHGNPKELARIGKRIAELEPLVEMLQEYDGCQKAIAESKVDQGDVEMQTLAEEEGAKAELRSEELLGRMRTFLLSKDPDDEKSVILEVRAGTGGEEAALFAAELLRMYLRYAEIRGWKAEILDKTDADSGGVKEASCKIEGSGVFGKLKYESGVHRVQRIPATESKGRVHTSTATVAILPEAEEVDIVIRPEDLRIDTFRSGGAGGQNVNKVESAIRITHIPTNTVVACQTERSQLQNRQNAMAMLRSRLYAVKQEQLSRERGDLRSGQIGNADRSEKIRTYNFPQDRLTDHRIGESFSNLPAIMEGEIDDILDALIQFDQEEQLKKL